MQKDKKLEVTWQFLSHSTRFFSSVFNTVCLAAAKHTYSQLLAYQDAEFHIYICSSIRVLLLDWIGVATLIYIVSCSKSTPFVDDRAHTEMI